MNNINLTNMIEYEKTSIQLGDNLNNYKLINKILYC
jgi:hypothetical protein